MPDAAGTPALSWERSRNAFVRGLGVVYLAAFLSLGVQLPGLIGSQGILPAASLVEALHRYPGSSALWPAPTLAYFGASDAALQALWMGGAAASLLVVAGLLPAPALAVAWVLYRSLATVGQVFLGFQWDTLLLETGLLAIFYAPWTLRLGGAPAVGASRTMRLLCWWLAFRLFFFSGFVKLASGDETWWNLTALSYHWWTQPLPAWTAWYVARLPDFVSRFSVAATLAIELGLPFLVWLGRAPRLVAVAGLVLLQLLIAATGSYGFFNLLAVVLCIPLVDDDAWRTLLRTRGAARAPLRPTPPIQRVAIALVAAFVLATSLPLVLVQAGLVRSLPRPVETLVDAAIRLGAVNTYGLFARMTTTRPEIVIEGTSDGHTWKPYVFPWKPGPLDRRPAFTGLHMPRLDWQMWFAALGPPEESPWTWSLLRHLLLGTRPVLDLFETNPFPDAPPVAVRALLYQYRFSTATERAATGAWWIREPAGEFIPETRLTTQGGEIQP